MKRDLLQPRKRRRGSAVADAVEEGEMTADEPPLVLSTLCDDDDDVVEAEDVSASTCLHNASSSSSCDSLSLVDDFEGYVHFRILDSIGYPGAYKKFMLARKDQAVEWAMRMARQVQSVQSALRNLEIKEHELRSSSLAPLHIVWQHVTESNLPPSDLQLTIANCAISRKTNIPCVVIRGKGRGAQPFTVNSRFAVFLYDLWVIYKMDVLIKTYARQMIEVMDPMARMSMAEIVDAFRARHADVRCLARAFFLAYAHVFRSAACGLQAII